MPRLRLAACALALAAVCALGLAAVPGRKPAPAGPVRLVVLVVFDQMRGDYVDKWRAEFRPDGFRKMQTEGAWFTHCHYPYATTITGPGHASILTGTTPSRHGIVGNDWFDRAAGGPVYCAASDRYDMVPGPRAPGKGQKPDPKSAGNPDRLLSESVGDVLKRATGGRGKVFGLSLKDRAAVLPAGRRPDGAYWFSGRFVTSTYYRDTLPGWVDGFNKSGAADRWFGVPWEKARPELDYAALAGADDVKGEGGGDAGRGFPHRMDGGKPAVGKEYYNALVNSPYGNDLLLEFAKACVVAENLGRDDVPDLLTLSFSSNDLIGHTWGPDSQEVFDVTLRSDRVLAELLAFLNARVGEDKYAVVLTADHGVCPLPEVAAKRGIDARRISTAGLFAGADKFLQAAFGPAPAADPKAKGGQWVEAVSGAWVYLNRRQLAARKINVGTAAAGLAKWFRGQPDVYAAYTAADLDALSADDDVGRRVKASYHRERSGEVYVVLKQYLLPSDPLKGTGTSHGTPFPYDTHVPLLVYGPGVDAGVHTDAVTPQAAAAVAAKFLGVPPPVDALYGVPGGLFEE